MGVLDAESTTGFNAFRPYNDPRIGGTATIGFPLPAAERRVAGPGPAPGAMGEGIRAAPMKLAQPALELPVDRRAAQIAVSDLPLGWQQEEGLGLYPLGDSTLPVPVEGGSAACSWTASYRQASEAIVLQDRPSPR